MMTEEKKDLAQDEIQENPEATPEENATEKVETKPEESSTESTEPVEKPQEKPVVQETAEKKPEKVETVDSAEEAPPSEENKSENLTAEVKESALDASLQDVKFEIRDGEKYIRKEDLPQESEYTTEEHEKLVDLYSNTMSDLHEGTIVQGKIIAISDKEVAVDIGFKSEGIVPIEEFDDPSLLIVGNDIEVYLDSVEDSEGQLQLSKKKADFMRIWEHVKKKYEQDEIITGKCTRRIKGGMVVDLGGVDAFLPGSQIDVRPIRDFESLIGQDMEFRILKINDLRKNVVISHKVLVEESLREVREKLLGDLKVNDILEGTVKNITDFGVFVDLGGVDGLLHITDLSWGRVTHPSEVVQLDQKIRVMVLNYDEERQRISLGLKQLFAHLWEEIDQKYHVGQKVQGKIVSLAKYGAFVELEPGIEGLVHISEMSWTQHVKHPSQIVRESDHVQVMILNIDKESRKISLGLKQVEEDPWESFETKYSIDSVHKGTVRDLVPFGAFIELEDGIDGLIHISDLSWTKRIRHPGEILKKGQEVEVIVLAFDRNERRIALGYKQLEENPWDIFERDVPVKGRTSGTVTRIIDKGVLVELSHGLEGFVPNSQIAKKFYEGKKRSVQIGDVLKLVVLEYDKEDRKIILSNSHAENKEDAKMAASYLGQSGKLGATIGDSLEKDSPLMQALKAAKEEEKAQGKKKPKAKSRKSEPVNKVPEEPQKQADEEKAEPAAEKAEKTAVETVEEPAVEKVDEAVKTEKEPSADESDTDSPKDEAQAESPEKE